VATATGIDGILPLMPAIGRAFGATQAEVQLTLTTFMLGIAVGQLVHGPISDRFGRKLTILGGLVLNTVATAACAMSISIEMLMVFRFVHGIAASSGWLIARAVVRDRHERGDAARVISVMMVFHGMSPLISPIVGAHLTVANGWQAMFVFLSVYAACVTVMFGTLFRETIHAKDPGALRPGPILRNFAEVSRSRSFWAYTACAADSYGILFAFLGTSSHVIISYFGETETYYSCMFAGCMVGSMSGMLTGARLVGRFGVDA
jgi:DHA1 family bicyclomycin/chloramphenicol resistance-like MFS transporter